MIVLEIALFGGLGIFALYWQYKASFPDGDLDLPYIVDGEEMPKRVKIPFFVGMLLFAGSIIYTIIALSKGGTNFVPHFWAGIWLIFKSFVFWLFFVIKSYFGPVVFGIIAITIAYNLIEHGILQSIPFFTWAIDWVFGVASPGLHLAYTLLVGVYSFGISVLDVDFHELFS